MKLSTNIILLISILISISAAQAQPAETWKTGQTTCHDESGEVIDCAGTGQDGDVQAGVDWPSPRFVDNEDGTITDNLTGLVWLKNANCFGYLTWSDALVACNTLSNGTCGLSDGSVAGDWRLPNRKELLSLLDFSTIGLTSSPFQNIHSYYNWSSTSNPSYPEKAWGVHTGGFVDYLDKSYGAWMGVWPVRDASECSGDVDGDQDVDGKDLSIFVKAFGSEDSSPDYDTDADFGSDGDVDVMDLIFFSSTFGKTKDNYDYKITDIEISGKDSYAKALNDFGQVVGYTVDSFGVSRAFIWDKIDGLIEIETLSSDNSRANDINNSGQVIGDEYFPLVGFIWEDESGIQPLCEITGFSEPPYILSCSASAINDAGAIVGNVQYGDSTVPVKWNSIDEISSLGFPPPEWGWTFSNPNDINQIGKVVGILHDTGWEYSSGFIWDFTNHYQVLYTLGEEQGSAISINNYGTAVGYSGGDKFPFIWNQAAGKEALLSLGGESSAMAINDSGGIVGYYSEFPYGDKRACLWRGNQAFDLNNLIPADSGWVLRVATDINEHGQIVGYGELSGETHAFLLDP